MEDMIRPLKRYAQFSGRSSRREYWMFTLFLILVALAWFMIYLSIGKDYERSGSDLSGLGLIWIGAAVLFFLGLVIPSIAVSVRRLHDVGLSGWLYLISFIPYIGGLFMLVIALIPGNTGHNKYGPDPHERGTADIFI